jgi:hypothetical protein
MAQTPKTVTASDAGGFGLIDLTLQYRFPKYTADNEPKQYKQ